ncbi:MAG: metallophosphoesterase [Polyangiales bacterium]
MAPSHEDPDAPEETWVAVADLHGHLAHFNALLAHLDRTLGDSYRLCTLGDYVDNGPAVPALLDWLIDLSRTRGDRFAPIVGNHDLALLRTLGWPHVEPDARWWTQWRSNYWNPGLGTPAAYGASSFGEFVSRFPEPHHALLRSLPRCHDTGRYLFVHAGATRGPLAPQREDLAQRVLPLEPLFLPPMIRDKMLARVDDASWDRIVVSAHTGADRLGGPRFVSANRVCLAADVDKGGALHAVVLPSRAWLSVDANLCVTEER